MPDLIRFVDSIDATPTSRLDVNDGASWWVKSFTAPPPRLRRSMSSNALTDGVSVGSSTYEARTITLELECRKPTQDAAATEMQKLWRELDRAVNYLQYQPQGASKPVFFVLYRSDASQLEDVMAQAAMRTVTVELLAMPFALGAMETLGAYVIANNPAAATNPGYVDLPAILGDVPADLVYWDSASGGASYMARCIAMHSGGAAVSTVTTAVQAESMSAGSDTSNPGGGPDAAMSGTGVNNFMRTTFATTSILNADRLTASSVAQPGGRYRLYVAVRRSGTSSTLQVRAILSNTAVVSVVGQIGRTVTLPATTSRQMVDLGIFSWPEVAGVGVSGVAGTSTARIALQAGRTGGTDSLDWDCLIIVPAGGQPDSTGSMMLVNSPNTSPAGPRIVLDGANDQAFTTTSSSNPTTTAVPHVATSASGAFPKVAPGNANRLYVQSFAATTPAAGVTTTTTVTLAYWPRYLLVRPTST